MRLFHSYGNWLVSISWKLFFLLAILLMICAAVLAHLPPFNIPIGQEWSGAARHRVVPPVPPMLAAAARASATATRRAHRAARTRRAAT